MLNPDGLLDPRIATDHTIQILRIVLAGARVTCDSLDSIRGSITPSPPSVSLVKYAITDRERQLLAGLARGLTEQQVAQDIGISERTVQALLGKIKEKLNATSRTHAVALAVANGLVLAERDPDKTLEIATPTAKIVQAPQEIQPPSVKSPSWPAGPDANPQAGQHSTAPLDRCVSSMQPLLAFGLLLGACGPAAAPPSGVMETEWPVRVVLVTAPERIGARFCSRSNARAFGNGPDQRYVVQRRESTRNSASLVLQDETIDVQKW